METRIKSIWAGSIAFGLINIPVKLYSAVKESNLELHMLDKNDYASIKFKRVNENTGEEVPSGAIVKGYLLDDRYVLVEDSDFEAAEAEKTKMIGILHFVDEKEIDTIYYEQPYYLEPDKGAMKAYGLLRDALQASAKVGVGTIVLRNRESLVLLKSYKNVIVLNRIRFQEEIRDSTGFKVPPFAETNTKEMDMALMLIGQLTEKFDISKYKDTYTAKLLEIIKDKAKGKKHVAPQLKVVHKQNDDLMAMLKASLEKENSKSS